MRSTIHLYEIRPRKDHRGFDLISDALPHWADFGMASQTRSATRFGYAKFRSRSHDAVIRVFDEAGNVIKTEEHGGNFREPVGTAILV